MGDGDIKRYPAGSSVCTLRWERHVLKLIDQRSLPFKEIYVTCRSAESVAGAIKDMIVRGAPAIGVAAGYGIALAALNFKGKNKEKFISHIDKSIKLLSGARPTAVNLFWVLDRMKKVLDRNKNLEIEKIKEKLIGKSIEIEKQDLKINRKIGHNGKKIFKEIKSKIRILTHCNAGALATSGYGTALAVIRSLNAEDKIASNGDTANKIGTLTLSILARYYRIPFYIAAPISTIDMKIKSGDNIPIEYRDKKEVREILGKVIIPEFMAVENPAFDVTPADKITAIITENGVIYPPYKKNIGKIFANT